VSPLRGEKPQNWPLSKLNTGRFALRAMLPVTTATYPQRCCSEQVTDRQTRKVKPICILMKQEMMGWQWHQLHHMQIICISLETDNHASTSSVSFFTGRMLFLMPSQQSQSTELSEST